jgi:tetratricopeptide (TPR) repeat protein
LVRILPADAARAVVEREVKQLRRCADEEGGSTWEYYEVMSREAERLGLAAAFRAELIDAWNNGAGDLSAGIVLLRDRKDAELSRTWELVQRHPLLDVNALERAATALAARQNEPRRVIALERIARLEADEPRRVTEWGRALINQGRLQEAKATAEELIARAVFDPEAAAPAAELCAAAGDLEKASELYAAATAADPAVRTPEVHLAYARVLMKLRKLPAARAALKRTSRNRSAALVPAALEYLEATGQLEAGGGELADLGVGPAQWTELRRGCFAKLLGAGKLEGAFILAEQYPQLLGEEQARQLRTSLKDIVSLGRGAALLDQVRMQNAPHLTSETAEMFAALADAELASLQVDSALVHLVKAHELVPARWVIAERLSGLYVERGDLAKAAQTLRAFMAATRDDSDREKAKQSLSRIPSA